MSFDLDFGWFQLSFGESFGPVIWILFWVAAFVWVLQVVDVMVRDPRLFDNHTHKLTWFLVIFLGNILGAIWYLVWKQQVLRERRLRRKQQQIEQSIQLWKAEHEPAPE